METSKWNLFVKLGEEKVTKLVDHVLSRSYVGGRCRTGVMVEEALESLDLPSRQEMNELRGTIDTLNGKLQDLLSRLEKIEKRSPATKGAVRKTPQEDLLQKDER